MNEHDKCVNAVINELERGDFVGRIWRRDHTVWSSEAEEVIHGVEWLNAIDKMSGLSADLKDFAKNIVEDGFDQVVILGMGGSSLGAETIHKTFGSKTGFADLSVLDSTIPESIKSMSSKLDIGKTLFVVSSKSGTTLEPMLFYEFFKNQLSICDNQIQGSNFIAITDHESPLAKLAVKDQFRKIFLNPADVCGRYSVLTYFGLVPAALVGVDMEQILNRAADMYKKCGEVDSIQNNPGAMLGAFFIGMHGEGRDKLTLLTSPAIDSFGFWAEQLVAESTGKDGTGIVPIVGEPLIDLENYGSDRFFVYLRLEDDDNQYLDEVVSRIQSKGLPIIKLSMADKYDIGAEFYRWEFATALASGMMGVNAFNQPNVQRSKEEIVSVLNEYLTSGKSPELGAEGSFQSLMQMSSGGEYLAIMVYLEQTPELDRTLGEFRKNITDKYGIATTVGYGPRFLHSTGQLHKGGPESGLYLQLVSQSSQDVDIPGRGYGFGTVAQSQSLGDFRHLRSLGRHAVRVEVSQVGSETILDGNSYKF